MGYKGELKINRQCEMRERRVINENTYSHPFFFFFPPQNLCFYQMYLALSSDFEVPTLLKILDLETILCPPVVVGIGDFESPGIIRWLMPVGEKIFRDFHQLQGVH